MGSDIQRSIVTGTEEEMRNKDKSDRSIIGIECGLKSGVLIFWHNKNIS